MAAAVVQAGVNDGLTEGGSPEGGKEWSGSGLMIWMQSVGEREESKMTPGGLSTWVDGAYIIEVGRPEEAQVWGGGECEILFCHATFEM